MHYQKIMTIQTSNNALLCKVFPSSLTRPTLSWFHRLAPNSETTFLHFSEKFVSQYMCLIRRKQSVTSLFHVRMERSKTIRDFVKRFGAALLQLDLVSLDTSLQVIKQAIRLNTQFFTSPSLQPPALIVELFQ